MFDYRSYRTIIGQRMLTRKDAEALAREVRAVPYIAGSWHSGHALDRFPVTVGTITAFGDEGQAVMIANDGDYALAATLWTTDVSRAHTVARRIRAGAVAVNGWSPLDAALPWEAPGSAATDVNSAGPASRRTPKRRPSRSSSERHHT